MNEKFGDLIKRLRIENGLTIKELADKSGFSSVEIRNIESNKFRPRVNYLKKLSEALNCDYYYLFEQFENN